MKGLLLLAGQALATSFVENQGQWDFPARFVSQMGPMTAFVEDRGWSLTLLERDEEGQARRGVALRMTFEGGSAALLAPEDRLPGYHNYFLGTDPAKWRADVPLWGRVRMEEVYPGVDVVLREERGRFEYDLLLEPGADLAWVVMRVEGARGLRLDAEGGLVFETTLGEIRQPAPKTWEVGPGGEERGVECRHVLLDSDRFGFEARRWNPSSALVIDPGLVYSTFLGGAFVDEATAIAVDASGSAIVAGYTTSPTFPTTPCAFDETLNASTDAFVTCLSPSGANLVFSTFLGGTGSDSATDLAIDATGAVTVTGRTSSADFPTTPGTYDPTYNGVVLTPPDVFVSRLSSLGNNLVFSTYLGGVSEDLASSVALDAAGDVVVGGRTWSPSFPTTPGSFDPTHNGMQDGFVSRLSSTGSSLVWSTFLGGADEDWALAHALGASGDVVVAGRTWSSDFPSTPGAFDPSFNGGQDGFVVGLSSSGSTMLFGTFLGGSGSDTVRAVGLQGTGVVTVTGSTGSLSFPTTPGSFDTISHGTEAFVPRLASSGANLVYSTFLGGASSAQGRDLVVDASGATTVAGSTSSADFPTTPGGFDTVFGAFPFGEPFVLRLSPAGASVLYSTYFGSAALDSIYALAVDQAGLDAIAGSTPSPSFPTTPAAFDTSHNGFADAFVAKLDLYPAGASPYGNSTPGCSGPLPIGVNSWPQVGNAAFAVTCANAPPNAVGYLGFSGAGLATPYTLGPLEAWIDPASPVFLTVFVASSAMEEAAIALPIPASPALAGLQVYPVVA
jgi:hypothetical protein